MDRDWVGATVREACERAGVTSTDFLDGILAGLEVGRKQYGEHAYRGRDNAKEGRYEARDAAAYALMEISDAKEAHERGDLSGWRLIELELELLRVIALAAEIDCRFARTRHLRLG